MLPPPPRYKTRMPLTAIPASIPRVALVTGGAHRLGRAISLALAAAGFDIAVHAREPNDSICAENRQLGRRADAENIWSEASRTDADNHLLKSTLERLHASK